MSSTASHSSHRQLRNPHDEHSSFTTQVSAAVRNQDSTTLGRALEVAFSNATSPENTPPPTDSPDIEITIQPTDHVITATVAQPSLLTLTDQSGQRLTVPVTPSTVATLVSDLTAHTATDPVTIPELVVKAPEYTYTDLTVAFDGASHGNPGPSGAGWVIIDQPSGVTLTEDTRPLGKTTALRAEFEALICGLHAVSQYNPDAVTIVGDCHAVFERLNDSNTDGTYGPLVERVLPLLETFSTVTHRPVPRCRNTTADRLATTAAEASHRQTGGSA
ncbi:reverse transcriptase-like protein [Halobaculum sp. MBLA0147]|uniref:reverse transcriptase-like protein n=1 Tax=Halobaculum sp. MBLA0147 TaxID=3079934 RepID=UPI0035251FD2